MVNLQLFSLIVINNLKVNKAEKKAEDLINKANKEIEKSNKTSKQHYNPHCERKISATDRSRRCE